MAFLMYEWRISRKKIRRTDVAKTYEQSAQLAIIVITEVERQLYATFISNLEETTELVEVKNSPASLADYLATSFPLFLQTKLGTNRSRQYPQKGFKRKP